MWVSVNVEMYFKKKKNFCNILKYVSFRGSILLISLMEVIRNEILHERFISILLVYNVKQICLLTQSTMTSTFKYVDETGLGKFWSILIPAHEQAITLGLVV